MPFHTALGSTKMTSGPGSTSNGALAEHPSGFVIVTLTGEAGAPAPNVAIACLRSALTVTFVAVRPPAVTTAPWAKPVPVSTSVPPAAQSPTDGGGFPPSPASATLASPAPPSVCEPSTPTDVSVTAAQLGPVSAPVSAPVSTPVSVPVSTPASMPLPLSLHAPTMPPSASATDVTIAAPILRRLVGTAGELLSMAFSRLKRVESNRVEKKGHVHRRSEKTGRDSCASCTWPTRNLRYAPPSVRVRLTLAVDADERRTALRAVRAHVALAVDARLAVAVLA